MNLININYLPVKVNNKIEYLTRIAMINFLDKKLHYSIKLIIKMIIINPNSKAINTSDIRTDQANY
jgi:hypothetical protein